MGNSASRLSSDFCSNLRNVIRRNNLNNFCTNRRKHRNNINIAKKIYDDINKNADDRNEYGHKKNRIICYLDIKYNVDYNVYYIPINNNENFNTNKIEYDFKVDSSDSIINIEKEKYNIEEEILSKYMETDIELNDSYLEKSDNNNCKLKKCKIPQYFNIEFLKIIEIKPFIINIPYNYQILTKCKNDDKIERFYNNVYIKKMNNTTLKSLILFIEKSNIKSKMDSNYVVCSIQSQDKNPIGLKLNTNDKNINIMNVEIIKLLYSFTDEKKYSYYIYKKCNECGMYIMFYDR